MTLVQREIAKLENQLHQAKERGKGTGGVQFQEKEGRFSEDEVGSKRIRQQAKRAKAPRQGPPSSPPSPPRKGFKMLPTGDFSDSEEDEDLPEQNV